MFELFNAAEAASRGKSFVLFLDRSFIVIVCVVVVDPRVSDPLTCNRIPDDN